MSRTYEFALVPNREFSGPVVHYKGLPLTLTNNMDEREMLPKARVVLMELQGDEVTIFRLSTKGAIVGDTWHQTIDDALHQLAFEYGEPLTWSKVPPDCDDPFAYALQHVG